MLTVVVYHVDLPGATRAHSMHARAWSYQELLGLALRSASVHHPACRKVILTDEATEFPNIDPSVQVIRRDIDPRKLILERTISQINFLKHDDHFSHVVMIDADMLINGDLESIFHQEMDLGLTYRNSSKMPINGGFIAIASHGRLHAIRFLERVARLMSAGTTDQFWWGDQHALIEALGPESFPRRTADVMQLDSGGHVILWPCATHNFTPPKRLRGILRRGPECKVIHFKGSRKRLLRRYWEIHLSPDESRLARRAKWLRLLASCVLEEVQRTTVHAGPRLTLEKRLFG